MCNHRSVFTLAALSCALLAPVAARADILNSTTLSVQASSLGYGVGVARDVAPGLDVRVSSGSLNFGRSGTSDNLGYQGQIHLANVAALVDVHPLFSPFRVTGGLLFGNDHIDVTGTPSGGSFTVNGNVYPAAGTTITGTAKLSSGAPYLGFGFGTSPKLRTSLTFDAGVVFRNVTTSLTANGALAANPQFQSDLAQAQSQFQNSVGFLKTYPVVSLGIATRV
jgi:hypothetical protein